MARSTIASELTIHEAIKRHKKDGCIAPEEASRSRQLFPSSEPAQDGNPMFPSFTLPRT
jgi:hypothetical protein